MAYPASKEGDQSTMARLTQDQIEDLKNALRSQQANSVEDTAYSNVEYCGNCGNIECTCLYKARKKAIEDGPKFTWIPLILFIIAGCIIFKLVKNIF